ncbi:MAG: hypothetical protein AAF770_03740, partial [Bacteroidota bacterium]
MLSIPKKYFKTFIGSLLFLLVDYNIHATCLSIYSHATCPSTLSIMCANPNKYRKLGLTRALDQVSEEKKKIEQILAKRKLFLRILYNTLEDKKNLEQMLAKQVPEIRELVYRYYKKIFDRKKVIIDSMLITRRCFEGALGSELPLGYLCGQRLFITVRAYDARVNKYYEYYIYSIKSLLNGKGYVKIPFNPRYINMLVLLPNQEAVLIQEKKIIFEELPPKYALYYLYEGNQDCPYFCVGDSWNPGQVYVLSDNRFVYADDLDGHLYNDQIKVDSFIFFLYDLKKQKRRDMPMLTDHMKKSKVDRLSIFNQYMTIYKLSKTLLYSVCLFKRQKILSVLLYMINDHRVKMLRASQIPFIMTEQETDYPVRCVIKNALSQHGPTLLVNRGTQFLIVNLFRPKDKQCMGIALDAKEKVEKICVGKECFVCITSRLDTHVAVYTYDRNGHQKSHKALDKIPPPVVGHIDYAPLIFIFAACSEHIYVYNMVTKQFKPCDSTLRLLAQGIVKGGVVDIRHLGLDNKRHRYQLQPKYAMIHYDDKVYIIHISGKVLTISEYHIHQNTITYIKNYCQADVHYFYDCALDPPYLYILCKTTGKDQLFTLYLNSLRKCYYTHLKEIKSKEAIKKIKQIDLKYKEAVIKTKRTNLKNELLKLIQRKKWQEEYINQCKNELAVLEKPALPYDDITKRKKLHNAFRRLLGFILSIAKTSQKGILQMDQSTELAKSVQKIDLLHYIQDVLSDVSAPNLMLYIQAFLGDEQCHLHSQGKKELLLWFSYLLRDPKEYLEKDLEQKQAWGALIDIKFEEGTLTFIYPRYGNPVYSFGIPTTIFKQLLPIVT